MEPIPHPPAVLAARLGRWSAGRGPLYLLLAARLRALIDEGVLPPGALLPPDRRLAAALAVGRTTVVAAYDALRQEGRLVRRQGSGTRVAPAALPAEAADGPDGRGPRVKETSNPLFLHLLEAPDDVILLSCAAPAGPPPVLTEAYRSLVLPETDLGYHPAGVGVLRTAIAERYGERGVPTAPEQVLVTTGAQQGLALLARLLLAPGDGVLVEAPSYPGALDLFREAAAVPLPVAVGRDGLDVAEAVRTLERHRPALAYVVARFQNPTGTVLPPLAGRRLVEAANALGVPLVDDEALADLHFAEEPPGAPLSAYGEVIAVGSLSKVVWGGLRVGWVRGPAPLIARLARLKALHDLGGDVPSQLVAARLLGAFGPVLEERRRAVLAGHDLLRAELARRLPSWECAPATGGQTLWVELPYGDGVSFAQLALRHGVAVLPGATTDALGGSVRRLRLHFLAPPGELTEAVRRLAAAWAAYAPAPGPGGGAGALHAIVV
ncbi:aminotransferase-like domain-containing protein [Streptomyces sp. NPDC003327]